MQSSPSVRILRVDVGLPGQQVLDDVQMAVQSGLVQRGLSQPAPAARQEPVHTPEIATREQQHRASPRPLCLQCPGSHRIPPRLSRGTEGRPQNASKHARRCRETRTPFDNVEPAPACRRVQRRETRPRRGVVREFERLHVIRAHGAPKLRLDTPEVARGCCCVERFELGRRWVVPGGNRGRGLDLHRGSGGRRGWRGWRNGPWRGRYEDLLELLLWCWRLLLKRSVFEGCLGFVLECRVGFILECHL